HFSDGDNWGDDIPHCIELLNEKLLPKVNLFGYGQVESRYGSGEFYEYIHEMLGERDNLVASRIPDRDAILGSIKEFLGKGRLHGHSLQHESTRRLASSQGRDRRLCARLRTGFLRDHLRSARCRGSERSGRLRRFPDALSSLVVWD